MVRRRPSAGHDDQLAPDSGNRWVVVRPIAHDHHVARVHHIRRMLDGQKGCRAGARVGIRTRGRNIVADAAPGRRAGGAGTAGDGEALLHRQQVEVRQFYGERTRPRHAGNPRNRAGGREGETRRKSPGRYRPGVRRRPARSV